jgi:hypothetical protein
LKRARAECKKKDAIRHLSYFADPRADIKGANARVWEKFVRDFEYCVENFRSVLVDTMTELLDVRKLAEFGRTTQILQIYYGGFYADLRWMVKHALAHDANVIFMHRMKKEYKNDNWQGGYELDGWRGIVYESQAYLEHDRTEDGDFITTIKDCGQDARLNGMALSSNEDENNFTTFATRVYPDSDAKDWE